MSSHSVLYQHLRLDSTSVLPFSMDHLSPLPQLLLYRVSSCVTSQLSSYHVEHISSSVPVPTPSITISGGAVAVIIVPILAISVSVITIVALVLKYRHRDQSIKRDG